MSIFESNVSAFDIEESFRGTNFGSADHRTTLEQGVLQIACGYATGGTLFSIMINLGLVTRKSRVTKKGRAFMFAAFHQDPH